MYGCKDHRHKKGQTLSSVRKHLERIKSLRKNTGSILKISVSHKKKKLFSVVRDTHVTQTLHISRQQNHILYKYIHNLRIT